MGSRYHSIEMTSPVGGWLIDSNGQAIIGVYSEHHSIGPASGCGGKPDDVCQLAAAQLAEYFAGKRREFDVPIEPDGSSFERSVWAAVRQIPYGETRTYGQIARSIGQPNAYRSVGAANGRNLISILIPCHRVVGANGSLTGYAGGLKMKEWLLRRESRK